MVISLLTMLIGAGSPVPPRPGPEPDRCPSCQAAAVPIRREVEALQVTRWREREAAARELGKVHWQCHPEVVAALAETVRDDRKAKVRAAAAGALGRLVPNLPASHLALDEATRGDSSPVVRKQAKQALAAKGLRCETDCPLCGPLPRGAAITGPTVILPQFDRPQVSTKIDTEAAKGSSSLPAALPNPIP